ncbi:beta propeller domain protein [archaeon BMS3Abin17]|nr:beta propeller domain protein [archaeon BMS3Abin17]
MDDKFIMMNLNDEKSKKVAEVIGNKTCKKILNHLSETKEASEKDIADTLGIPLNTTEYNLKKLMGVGLVEKTKNFFWSKKGRKIPMYKVAKKHIVISPRSKPTLTALKTIIPLIAAVLVVNIILFSYILEGPGYQNQTNTFDSIKDMENFIEKNTISPKDYGGVFSMFKGSTDVAMEASTARVSGQSAGGADEYSETNIQVEGVDEADIVKNDGKYIYTASGNKVIIVKAYPAEDMEILSEIELSNYVSNIFINDDKLIIFSTESSQVNYASERCYGGCPSGRETLTKIYIYDVSDREEPELEHEISVTGNYISSRMIKDYVYVITNQHVYGNDIVLPVVIEDEVTEVIEPPEIAYSDIKDNSFQYTIILGIDIDNGETTQETMLNGYSSNIYVSQDNIYTTQYKYGGWYRGMDDNQEKTIIHKTSIDKLEINYVASGEVPGRILNQFSMDEYDDNFRIATTSRDSNIIASTNDIAPRRSSTQNNVYVLDENLNLIGELEGLAPGESIYSVRFMGERVYMVTFKKVDPLFVIDLSDSENPEVLGKLKIPGYSNYLHPYDENHIIGIGKDTEEAEKGDFAWYQGVKMAIFDVSDVENPIEMHKIIIGDRGTNSEALNDPKAFLFDREKELLVIPIELYEIENKTYGSQYGEYTFQGAYVYNINLEDGFDLIERITHVTEEDELKRGYAYDYGTRIRRSLYMDNILYTISQKIIKANDLDDDLDEINSVELPSTNNGYYGYAEEAVGIAG